MTVIIKENGKRTRFKAREVMYELAKDNDGIVWDFFHI